MGPFEAQIISVVFGVGGGVAALGLILRYKTRTKELELHGVDAELGPAVDSLREDLNEVRGQLADVQERLDFTERMLTAGRESDDQTNRSSRSQR